MGGQDGLKRQNVSINRIMNVQNIYIPDNVDPSLQVRQGQCHVLPLQIKVRNLNIYFIAIG